ncbi:MAG: preprotein translocase subunit SecD [Pseudoalteromonas tetraodonis]|jgi:preprotein translocase subunit SecD
MVNRNPLWRWLLLAAVLVFGVIYAAPNAFGDDPAIQVAKTKSTPDAALQKKIEDALSAGNMPNKGVMFDEGRLLVVFDDSEHQLAAADYLREQLTSDHIVALNSAPKTPQWLRDLGAEPMSLGLDLRGGVHFLLEVDLEFAENKAMERFVTGIKAYLRENGRRRTKTLEPVKIGSNYVLQVRMRKDDDTPFAQAYIDDEISELVAFDHEQSVLSGDEQALAAELDGLVFAMNKAESERIRLLAVEQNMTTLRNRVNQLGVSEPLVQKQGKTRIVVELPGIQDPAQVKQALGATATLEYRAVAPSQYDPYDAVRTGRIPRDYALYYHREGYPVLLNREVIVSGDQLVDANATIDQQSGTPAVQVTLDSTGAASMLKFTTKNISKPMAVVFIEYTSEVKVVNGVERRVREKHEEVISIASIRSAFSKNFVTTGLEPVESHQLAKLLRAGALAAPVYIVEERSIGPSLGAQHVAQGFNAVIIGFLLVVVFMALYYKAFGLIANVALFANLVLIVAIMSLMQSVLTLPGIAGIVLTVGMAVDANVLIFERIREELRGGSTVQVAINAGYEKAFSTIADANVTTLIAAVVLLAMGNGPIKGFAITLAVGILTSMFTAIVGTRTLVNAFWGGRKGLEKLPL